MDCNAVLAGLPAWTLALFQRVLYAAARAVSSRVTVWLRLFCSCPGCQSLRESSTGCACWFTSRLWDTRRNTSPTFWHRLQYFRSIYTRRFIVWQPRRAADTSTNWRQSLFCCCTADGAETDAIDGLVSSWSENIFCLILFTGTRIGIDSVMRPRSSSKGRNAGAIQCLIYSYRSLQRITAVKCLSSRTFGLLCTTFPRQHTADSNFDV